MITLYNVVSRDGFIATKDGDENFIPNDWWPETLKFFANYDSLVMGRKTYDAIQKYPPELLEPFERLSIKKIILTENKKFHPRGGYFVAHSPEEAFTGSNILVSSGPTLNNFLLENDFVDTIVFDEIPAEIGEGIRPFSTQVQKSGGTTHSMRDGIKRSRTRPMKKFQHRS